MSTAHTRIQGGIDFRQAYATSTGGAGNSMGSFTFNSQYVQKNDDGFTPSGSLGLSYASFMLGIPSSMSTDNNASYALMNPYYGWYGQDTWRVTKNLTVTLGLRVEYEQAPTERYNRALTYFDPTAQLPIAAAAQAAYAANPVPELAASSFTVQGGSVYAGVNGAPRQPWQNELMWLPRLSAAWQFSPKMILRGGYGIYYDSINVQNVTLRSVGFLEDDFHQPDERFRGELAGRKSRSRRLPAGGSVPGPQRRDPFRRAFGKLAGGHVSRRTGFLLLAL